MSEENKNIEEQKEEKKNGRFYTDEEIAMIEQKAGDKRVTQYKQKADKDKEMAVKEAEKLARMNEEDKYKYELEQREKAIAEKEKQLALAENRNEASRALASRGISIDLVDLVVSDDAEEMMENIKKLEEQFKSSVKTEVEKRIAGNAPKKNLENGEMTKEEFSKLSMGRQMELLEQNPDKYEKLL